ncbi:MAG: hypothetical protein BZY79_02410 [SAR202 cluster bacterium Casp-Chloro-G4]|nr:non-heme iron oxygenase ferredoxin subunit [Chloroflexota bacterium]MDA1228012.1 non-heme iron oxygenase ferredoxin subunit [Chloroflexota bacterium]PKB61684.1 MAG: hypothetical protein BZY79_02410 [SAR202 cluster bacterium Casp-Chloro-G4]
MAFQKVGKVDEVPEGKSKVFEVGNRPIAVCNFEGKLYGIEDVCTHDGASFNASALIGCEIECPRHGARFDVTNGKVTDLPAVMPVETFEVRIDGDDIEIDV